MKWIMFRFFYLISLAFLVSYLSPVYAEHNPLPAITKPIPVSELKDFSEYSPAVKNLISIAVSLSEKNLTYLYGSSDPHNKGMDCSGTIYYLLNRAGIRDAPRQANQMYTWAEKEGKLYHVTHHDFDSSDFSKLKVGDLLFWSGTYAVHRDPPITHVMIYLGKNTHNQPLMFGASDGRTYQGKKMWGVSVFDFLLPNDKSHVKFEGYSCVPHLTC